MAGTYIDFEIAPQLNGFIIALSGQTLLNIRNVEGKLDTHHRLQYKTTDTKGTKGKFTHAISPQDILIVTSVYGKETGK